MSSITVLVLAVCASVAAAQRPDFSGAWEMDRSRSISLPPGMQQFMIVKQTGDRIDLETKLVTAQGERIIKDSYTLDGKEAEFTPQGATGPTNGKGKRKGTWLPRGNGIVVNEEVTTEGEKGPVTTGLVRKWILSPDGATLTIDMYYDGPNGSYETKRIFLKK
ncbi:MAG: hypothetical protein WCF57_21760 [Pyrinomonadaceae bacterium]